MLIITSIQFSPLTSTERGLNCGVASRALVGRRGGASGECGRGGERTAARLGRRKGGGGGGGGGIVTTHLLFKRSRVLPQHSHLLGGHCGAGRHTRNVVSSIHEACMMHAWETSTTTSSNKHTQSSLTCEADVDAAVLVQPAGGGARLDALRRLSAAEAEGARDGSSVSGTRTPTPRSEP